MGGERDLQRLLADTRAELRPGRYVFTTLAQPPNDVAAVVTVREDEGTTLVVEQAEADRRGWHYEFVAAMITLGVHSALDAVGLTAAVAERLAGEGISCNIAAGYYHDHLFVPIDRGDEAVRLLND